MIRFLLNDKIVSSDLPAGFTILDFVRYEQNLKGTKIGCREGDCGACTVLVGEVINGNLSYRSMTSCLLAIGHLEGKHLVTIEGINMDALNPIQNAMAEEGATQCGFCTPGFVMSLAGFCLSHHEPSFDHSIASIDGNICRCTGYKSIERAAARITELMAERKGKNPISYACENKILPDYFTSVKEILLSFINDEPETSQQMEGLFLAGGTDLYVQRHDDMKQVKVSLIKQKPETRKITRDGNKIRLSAGVTVTDLRESEIILQALPDFKSYSKLVSSTPIRNMATVAGNFVNASPIGDLSIFFLALDAHLELKSKQGNELRDVALKEFYKGYKLLDKGDDEFVAGIWFTIPSPSSLFHFEKVSKRTHLDIASVNSAILLNEEHGVVVNASISAGGVSPVPLYLKNSSTFLLGKKITPKVIDELLEIVKTEISPISDARGSKEYKSLLLLQLIKAHFIKLYPTLDINNKPQ